MVVPPVPKSSFRRRVCGCLFQIPEHAPKLYCDKAYDFVDWEWHQNAAWRHRLEPLMFFVVASSFIWQLAHVLLISFACGMYHAYLVPLGWPDYSSQLNSAFGMVTTCLSLLLVFRTNSSYSRWWEARIVWGSVVNLSRNYARLMMTWAPPERTHIARLGARWMAVAVHVTRAHLRAKHVGRVAQEAGHILTIDEFAWLAQWRSAPQGAAHVLGWAAANLGVKHQREQVLQELIVTFINNLGMCERILRTPMPTAYTSHTSRFVIIYITMSPILLWSVLGWATPVCAVMIAFLLLGTENIGVQIEEPFKVLPLDSICNTIENSIRDMEKIYYGSCSMEELRQWDAQKLAKTYDEDEVQARDAQEGAAAMANMEALFVGKIPPLQNPSTTNSASPSKGKPPLPVPLFNRMSSNQVNLGAGAKAPEVQMMRSSLSPAMSHDGSQFGTTPAAGPPKQANLELSPGHHPADQMASRSSFYPASQGGLPSDSLYASHHHVNFGVAAASVASERASSGQRSVRAGGSQHGPARWTSAELLAHVGVPMSMSPPTRGTHGSHLSHFGTLLKQFTKPRSSMGDDADPVVWEDEAPAVPDSPRSRSAHFREALAHNKTFNKNELNLYGGEFPEAPKANSVTRESSAHGQSVHDRSLHRLGGQEHDHGVHVVPEDEAEEVDETQAMLAGQERSGRGK